MLDLLRVCVFEMLICCFVYSPSAWWLCRRRPLCVQRSQTRDTGGEKRWGQLDSQKSKITVFVMIYSDLIVKGSVGSFFDWSLFLLITDLNHHTGVDVFSHQLPGLCDVNGNLRARQNVTYHCTDEKDSVIRMSLNVKHNFFCIFIVHISLRILNIRMTFINLSLCIKMATCVLFNYSSFFLIIYIFFSFDELFPLHRVPLRIAWV